MDIISGFSRKGREEKLEILKKFVPLDNESIDLLNIFQQNQNNIDANIRELSENYISNFILPFSIAPNFVVNGRSFFVPMVTEESSVVAAASYAAKFWSDKGGFVVKTEGTKKTGQIYFTWGGEFDKLKSSEPYLKKMLISSASSITRNMVKRGGGITNILFRHSLPSDSTCYIMDVEFETIDSMGANFINSCLETIAASLVSFINQKFPETKEKADIVMAILSNYTPECVVQCQAECKISQLAQISGDLSPAQYVKKFETAINIANSDISRAVTHNKGIFNGLDALLVATGNDYRAVEACGHAYAAKDGRYRSLSGVKIGDENFRLTLRIPIALGTIGGATSVHPLAGVSLKILQEPGAEELMHIAAAVGLASNFAAITSLITGGIQRGHMKLHLNNILMQLNATEEEKLMTLEYFSDKQVTFSIVSGYLEKKRSQEFIK